MHFIKGKSIVKRVISSVLTCSMALSAIATNVFALETNSPTEEDFVAGTGMTITVDQNGNVVSSSNNETTITAITEESDVSTNASTPEESVAEENEVEANNDTSQSNETEAVNVDTTPPPEKFDKYFSLIDDNLVQTNTLFMKVSDSTVLTKNTNIVSNYGDVYVVSFESIEEARYAYSYYVNKVDFISDLSSAMVLASNNTTSNVVSNTAIADLSKLSAKDYSGYIAVIDTGANNADASLSVFDDDGVDYNSHGTQMVKYIKEENPNAKILSIKAFKDHTTNTANIYAGIRLAIDSNVSVINLSLAGYDIEKNAIIIDIIQEALDKGIKVVGAAGNYNTSALKYIPGCIDGVITVGAMCTDKTKYYSSNFDADVYVKATSTSEATARYTGMLTANKIDEDRTTTELANAEDFVYTPSDDEPISYTKDDSKNPTGTHGDKKAA